MHRHSRHHAKQKKTAVCLMQSLLASNSLEKCMCMREDNFSCFSHVSLMFLRGKGKGEGKVQRRCRTGAHGPTLNRQANDDLSHTTRLLADNSCNHIHIKRQHLAKLLPRARQSSENESIAPRREAFSRASREQPKAPIRFFFFPHEGSSDIDELRVRHCPSSLPPWPRRN